MAPTSKPKTKYGSDKQDVLRAKKAVAKKTKKVAAPKRNTTKIPDVRRSEIQRKRTQKFINDIVSAEKSGFVKITKKPILNEVTGKSTRLEYVETPKGKQYKKNTYKAYTKDPMQLKPKPTKKKTYAQALKEKSKNA